MSIAQLGYVGLGVSDLEAWKDLAVNVAGLQPMGEAADGALYLRMDEHHHRIMVHPSGEDDLLYVGWQVPTPYALDEMANRLRAAGVEVEEGSPEDVAQRKVKRLIKFLEPSGHRFEIFYGPLTLPGRPFLPSRGIAGFKADGLGVGHVVINVEDRDETERFYTQVLGFRLTDYGGGGFAFFHCDRRHHSIAVVPRSMWRSSKRLAHLMLEYTALDDVGTAYDLCRQRSLRIGRTLGKHVTDYMISFYLLTPSDWELEFGYGAREVDDATWQIESYDRVSVWGHERAAVPEPV